ncbi:MAG: hypothetical protein AB7V04_11160 [Desulfomonilaceae bacterium]
MSSPSLVNRLGSWFKRVDSRADSRVDGSELSGLKKKVGELEKELEQIKKKNSNGSGKNENLMTISPGMLSNSELCDLREEIELLRNEMQENIAAIHRLEILTLSTRIDLLNEFGKALPPTFARRTRTSIKPKGFSFGIITNGQRPEKLFKLIDSIRFQRIGQDRFEILVAGVVDVLKSQEGVSLFPMEQAAAEGRLGAMRNVLAKNARFNKFVSLDDDFLLHPNWALAVEQVKDDFDLATGIIVNPDLSRYCDWVNIIENYTFLRTYDETFDKCQYVTGGYGIYKDFIFQEHQWNDSLGFYQGEDVSFSRKLFDSGFQLKFIPKAIVMHDDERYRQKGYGVVRLKSARSCDIDSNLALKMEKLCPRTLS